MTENSKKNKSQLLDELQQLKAENLVLKETQKLFNNGPVVVFKWRNTLNWPVEYVSPNVSDIFGYTEDDFYSAKVLYADIIASSDLEQVTAEVKKASDEGVQAFDHKPYQIIHRDGSVRWLYDHTVVVRNKHNKITYFYGYLFDITEQKEMEQELLDSHSRYEETQRLASLGSWSLDLQCNKLHWSQEVFNIFDINPDKFDASYETFLNMIHPEDRDEVSRIYADSVSNHLPYDITHRLLMSDDSVKYVRECCETFYNDNGEAIRSVGTVQDITQYKEAELLLQKVCDHMQIVAGERANNLVELSDLVQKGVKQRMQVENTLREERDFVNDLIDTAQEIILTLDSNGEILRINNYLEKLSGYSIDDVQGKDGISTFLFEKNHRQARAIFQRVLAGEQIDDIACSLLTKNANKYQIAWYAKSIKNADGNINAVLVIGHDITKRKQAEKSLVRHRNILACVAEISKQFLISSSWELLIDRVLLLLGKAACVSRAYLFECHTDVDNQLLCSQRFEWCVEGVSPQIDNMEFQHVDWDEAGLGEWYEVLADNKVLMRRKSEYTSDEHNILDPQNVLSILMVPLFVNKKPWGFIGFDDCEQERVWSDIEIAALESAAGVIGGAIEREYSKQALRASEQRFRGLVESTNDWIWEVDINGVFTYASPLVEEMLGYKPEEIVGKTPFELMPDNEIDRVKQAFHNIVDTCGSFSGLESIKLHKDGTAITLETNGVPILGQHGKHVGYRGINRDISDRKLAEKTRIAQAEKQRDDLVREVHHRIKNHLQGLMGLLKQRGKEGYEYGAIIDETITQIESIAIVYGLQASDPGAQIYFGQMLEAIIHSAAGLTQLSLSNTYGHEIGSCEVDRGKAVALALAVNELIINAIKHFPPESEKDEIKIHHEHKLDCVILTVRNPGYLHSEFNYYSGKGLGTGLELVKAMLPGKGAELSIFEENNEVVAKLIISPPLLIDV